MSEYTVTVVEYPTKHLVGMKVRTSMSKAQADCTALWEAFGPRLEGLLEGGDGQGSYGVSIMVNAEEFDYWAAIAMEPPAAAPAGLGSLDIPAGLYAKAMVPNLEQLISAYMFLYEEWPKSQAAYTISDQAPCFELYPPNWRIADSFEVFMPVRKI